MKVTKHRCTSCEGEGQFVDVIKHGGGTEKALPASAAEEANHNKGRDELDDDAIVQASAPYPCRYCGGPGFDFYIEDDARFGESIRLDELPNDVEVVRVTGTPEWVAHHEGQPATFVWKNRYFET